MDIKIKFENCEVEAKIYETNLGKAIKALMPIESVTRLWGKEIYFEIPLYAKLENPKDEVEKGDIAYWPQGRCMCIFFGPTPISKKGKIIPASSVEVVGRIKSDLKILEKVKEGEKLFILTNT